MRGGGGYPERDVGKKKKEQRDCLGGILSIGFSQLICVSCSFNLLSFRNSLPQSLHVKFDCYFQSLKPEIVHLQPNILLFLFLPHSHQLTPNQFDIPNNFLFGTEIEI